MKATVFIGFFLVLLAAAFAYPYLGEDIIADENDHGNYDLAVEDSAIPQRSPGIRYKRATCDLLSFTTKFGSLNHAACAAHCLVLNRGFRGGYCDKGVCHCRK